MTDEHYYSPQELGKKWNVSPGFIRKHFKHERGVLKIGGLWRIPAAVAERVERRSQEAAMPRPTKYVARRTPDGTVVLAPRARSASPSS